ncbi:MAG: S9 family peptidase [Acidobacteria bacterium]|nr:S9 family peptidase [Acidobacteriota bacterium]
MKKLLLLLLACAIGIQAAELKKLTFEQAYLNRGESLVTPLPEIGGWLDGSRFSETRGGKIWQVDARSGRARLLLDPGALKAAGPEGLDWLRPADHSPDYARLAFIHGGDLHVFLKGTPALRRLTQTAGLEQNPLFSPDGKRIAYTAGGNLFVCAVSGGPPQQLTFDGSEEILNGYASWVYYEEILGRASRYRAFSWSPDSETIVFLRFDQSKVPQFPLFDAGGTYGRLEMQRYPKPGFPNPTVKIGFVACAGGASEWISFADGPDHYLTFLGWGIGGRKAYIQWLNRGQDELRIFEYDPAAKKLRLVYTEKQKAWIDFLEDGSFQPLADGGFLLLSSRSGWSHLLRVRADGREQALSNGEWSASRIEFVDAKRGLAFFSADREDSTRSDLYQVSLDGGPVRRLTRASGSHRVTFSTDGSYFFDRWSSLRQPAVLELCARDGKSVRRLGQSASAAMSDYDLGRTEIFRIPAADGLQLPAAWVLPPGFAASKKYPVVISVYGGPGARSVLDAFPRRLDAHYLAQEGIIVLAVDHRGSGHLGKRGMEAMHRCLGKWELADYSSAVAWLRTLPFVDGSRIGITGGSYGGYVAALAVTSAPDLFSCGIAEFSVMDWSLYDSVYTERYMDSPAENPDGYRQASVLSHAATYRGGLRLTHGSMDDNVHMQNTLQLLDLLLDQGKTAELMVYPGERHGIRGRKAVEEARSSLEFWKKHLLAEKLGPVGQVRKEKEE